MKYKILLIISLLFVNVFNASAHGDGPDFFSSIGKIYVVVAVMAATFIGIVFFIIYLDRKISKIENEISSHK